MSLNGSDPITVLGFTGLNMSYYLYVDSWNNLYLSDTYNHSVLLFLSNSTNSSMVAGTGAPGSNNNQLDLPFGVFVNQNRTIYIADFQNSRIMKWLYGATSGIIVAGNGTTGNGSTQVFLPTQVIVDTNEYMYISEYGNSRISRWGPNSTFGVCIASCTGTAGTDSTHLDQPYSLAFDSNGSLYVSDTLNSRVQKFQILDYQMETSTNDIQSSAVLSLNLTTISNQNDITITTTIVDTITTTGAELITTTIDETIVPIVTEMTTPTVATMITTTVADTITTTVAKMITTTNIYVQQPSPLFVPLTCSNITSIGLNCNISSTPCDILKPCQNNGNCTNTNSTSYGYICSCLSGFNGTQCQFDYRLCKPTTCWNNGSCKEISNTTFVCLCTFGWNGIHCETKINYCQNVTCENNGVCRPLFLNYSCECLGDSYSGRHCEIINNKIVIYQRISKSFAFIAILAMIGAAMFIIIMDVLKYVFDIDLTYDEVERIPQKKQKKKRKPPVILRFTYVHSSVPQSSEKAISTIEKTLV